MWICDWVQNGPHRDTYLDQGAATAEETLRTLGVTCVAWFCAGWVAA